MYILTQNGQPPPSSVGVKEVLCWCQLIITTVLLRGMASMNEGDGGLNIDMMEGEAQTLHDKHY